LQHLHPLDQVIATNELSIVDTSDDWSKICMFTTDYVDTMYIVYTVYIQNVGRYQQFN